MNVLALRRRTRCGPGPRRWTVRVFLEDLHGNQHDTAHARCGTEAEAIGWALATLERLRATSAEQLGGPDCRCYVAAVRGPDRPPLHAYLFSDWEPVEWDCPGGP
jgi:hypothetical protein